MSGSDREVLLRAYLLGALSPEEQEPIDDQIAEDEAAHEDLLATQDDLIHAYLADALPAADRERFESHFLASPRRRERMAFIRSLLVAVAREAPPAVAPGPAITAREPVVVPARRWTIALPWAAAVVIGLAGGAWSIGERRRADQEIASAQERERALAAAIDEQRERIRALEAQAAESIADVPTWTLGGNLLRGSRGTESHQAKREGAIRLRAPIAPEHRAVQVVASLQTPEGKELMRVRSLRATGGADGFVVDVIVGASLLPRGTYVLSLQSSSGVELGVTTFSVR